MTAQENKKVLDNGVYARHGYANRDEYLDDLADETGIDRYTVDAISDMLGEDEDFDGLVSSLEDYSMMF